METEYTALLVDLISNYGENEWIEFKENLEDPMIIGEYISALSNSAAVYKRDFGYLVWGIEDKNHSVVGSDFNHRKVIERSNEELQHWLARQLNPSLDFRFIEIFYQGKRVVVLEIPRARGFPTSFAGTRFIRIGSSKERLGRFPEREISLFHHLYEPESLITKESLYQDLTFERLFGYYNAKGMVLNKDTFAESMHLRTRNGKYNILAQLLADNNHIPMRLSTFRGQDKSSRMSGIKEFGNTCILLALDDILQYCAIINQIQSSDDGRIPRVDIPYFDQEAANEAIINAFVHNNWVDGNAPQFHVFKDRLEIISHGGIPHSLTKRQFLSGVSSPVNPQLAEVFLQLRISERTGRGVPRIVNAYGEKSFYFGDGFICVTIPFTIVDHDPEPQNGLRNYSKTQRTILELMADNPNITIIQLSIGTRKSIPAIKYNIALLKKAGIITRIGSDRDGYWQVNNG